MPFDRPCLLPKPLSSHTGRRGTHGPRWDTSIVLKRLCALFPPCANLFAPPRAAHFGCREMVGGPGVDQMFDRRFSETHRMLCRAYHASARQHVIEYEVLEGLHAS
ncbi:uncharacterized protein MEPE_01052 [Melanopsichium pennsylvanicum]|uniref:Uncharacterized protein n=1 Tax=Melanopsichium pennsylvanicum TaxID=63383 RepID=A0AAJ4XIJ7_9BASI|nr:uncharacterized protein MEPE_01052 [Melanopsichium pennsylvanicum]